MSEACMEVQGRREFMYREAMEPLEGEEVRSTWQRGWEARREGGGGGGGQSWFMMPCFYDNDSIVVLSPQ